MPVGLKNTGNTCYSNSIIQALLSTPPIANLLNSLKNKELPENVPILSDLFKIFNNIPHRSVNMMKEEMEKNGNDLEKICLNPNVLVPPLSLTNLLKRYGREEDAQEYLSILLEKLHDGYFSLIFILIIFYFLFFILSFLIYLVFYFFYFYFIISFFIRV